MRPFSVEPRRGALGHKDVTTWKLQRVAAGSGGQGSGIRLYRVRTGTIPQSDEDVNAHMSKSQPAKASAAASRRTILEVRAMCFSC